MSFPNRNNPYNFDKFLQWRNNFNYYTDDTFLQSVVKHFAGKEWEAIDKSARDMSEKVSNRWRDMSDDISLPENRISLQQYDAFNNRIDRLLRPENIKIMEKEIFSEKLFSKNTPIWERIIKMFLIYQNGEACIACPITCTEGEVSLLEKFADTPELKNILQHSRDGINGDFAIAAQYLTEIQGGSDVPANLVEAVNENDGWHLYGKKFFCSVAHADYMVVTAKPKGSEKIAIFVVPSWLDGNKEKEIRNGYTIDRLKWKMGTMELPTVEITFNGALAYSVGPMEKGLSNIIGIVLTYSRLTIGLSSAATMMRAVREAEKYAEIREAFGKQINKFPALASQLRVMDKYAKRTTAAAFKIYQRFYKLEGKLEHDFDKENDKKQNYFDVRILIMLQKITASWDAVDVIRSAISVFGGNGIVEDFSSLPRLFRDACVNELWEGPRNVLLAQIHRDFQKTKQWYISKDFVKRILEGSELSVIEEFSDKLDEFISYPSLLNMDEKTLEVCENWSLFCSRLFHTYQDLALKKVLSNN